MPLFEVDFLIVGQGLAGSLLAFELIQRGKKVLVLDNSSNGSSSQIAAGIINPITGHRLNLTEGFLAYLAQAKKTYVKLEQVIGSQIYTEIEQHRLIKNPGQASHLTKRLKQPLYSGFLEPVEQRLFKNSDYGAVSVNQTGLVDSKSLLQDTKSWLRSKGAYQAIELDYHSLNFEKNGVRLRDTGVLDVLARKIVFCEGYQAVNNPWLKALPFKLSKGEVLTISHTGHAQLTAMLNWGNWCVPQSTGLAKLGSNYAWDDLDLSPSDTVKQKLFKSLRDNTEINASLVKHEAGIRPTTKYRQPFIGPISSLENAVCFNGFGSKGCLTIPKHTIDLCDFLLNGKALSRELTQWL